MRTCVSFWSSFLFFWKTIFFHYGSWAAPVDCQVHRNQWSPCFLSTGWRILNLCIIFSFLYGHESKEMPPLKTGRKGLVQGWFFSPCLPLHVGDSSEPLPAAPRFSDPQDHRSHPGTAKVEIIHFGLHTVNSHLSPGCQRRCYLNDFRNECVHQRQEDIVYYLCACFVLWNIF